MNWIWVRKLESREIKLLLSALRLFAIFFFCISQQKNNGFFLEIFNKVCSYWKHSNKVQKFLKKFHYSIEKCKYNIYINQFKDWFQFFQKKKFFFCFFFFLSHGKKSKKNHGGRYNKAELSGRWRSVINKYQLCWFYINWYRVLWTWNYFIKVRILEFKLRNFLFFEKIKWKKKLNRNLEERYELLLKVIQDHALVSMGVSLFHCPNGLLGEGYKVQNFNFLLLCQVIFLFFFRNKKKT